MAVEVFMYLEAWFWETDMLEKEKRCCSASQQRTKSWQFAFKEKKMGVTCAEKVSGPVLVVLQSKSAWLDLVFQSSPCEPVLEVCWLHCIHSVLVNGVPTFRFHASPWVCLLSVGAHGTSCVGVTWALVASWPVFWQGAAAANTTFCLPCDVGPLQEHFPWHQAVLKVPWGRFRLRAMRTPLWETRTKRGQRTKKLCKVRQVQVKVLW